MSAGFITQPGPGFGPASSATSVAVGTGSQTFATQTGLAFVAGSPVIVTSTGSGAWMYGTVSSYSGGTLVVSVALPFGSGTHSDWSISLCGIPSVSGAWQTPTLQNSWANVSGGFPSRYRTEGLNGNMLRIGGQVSKASVPNTGSVAWTLPSGYLPSETIGCFAAAVVNSNPNIVAVQIAPAGTVTIASPINNASVSCWLDTIATPLT